MTPTRNSTKGASAIVKDLNRKWKATYIGIELLKILIQLIILLWSRVDLLIWFSAFGLGTSWLSYCLISKCCISYSNQTLRFVKERITSSLAASAWSLADWGTGLFECICRRLTSKTSLLSMFCFDLMTTSVMSIWWWDEPLLLSYINFF